MITLSRPSQVHEPDENNLNFMSDRIAQKDSQGKGEKVLKINGQDSIRTVTFLSGGVVSGGYEGKIRFWRLEDGEEVGKPTDANGWVYDIAVSQDGRWVVSGASLGRIRVWDTQNRETVVRLEGSMSAVNTVDVSRDGTKIVGGLDDSSAIVWERSTGKKLVELKHENSVAATKFSPHGLLIATATWRRESLRIYDSENGRLVVDFKISVGSRYNQSVAWSHDRKRLFALSSDGNIYHLDASANTSLSKWSIHSADYYPRCIALASDSTYIAASAGLSVSFWDTATLKQIRSPIEHNGSVVSIAVSPNHDIVTSAGKTISVQSLRDTLPSHYCDDTAQNLQRDLDNLQACLELLRQIAHLKRSVATKTDVLGVVRKELYELRHVSHELIAVHKDLRVSKSQSLESHQRYDEQTRELRSAVAINQPQLSEAVHAITDSDADAENAIVQILKQLNVDVWLSTMFIARSFVRHFQSVDAEARSSAVQRASGSIAQALASNIERMSQRNASLYLPIALRAYLNHHLYRIISLWTVDKGGNDIITGIYKRVKESGMDLIVKLTVLLTRTTRVSNVHCALAIAHPRSYPRRPPQ
ncbi:WD40-repeat-containing domain protein [Chiua virens]|nr:WD40-repeat-containing domain protein [Chiua virens]